MISPKVWRTLTDLNEDDAISRYKSTRRQEAASAPQYTVGGHTRRSSASSYRSRRRWVGFGVWALLFAGSACLWIVIVQVARFIAQWL